MGCMLTVTLEDGLVQKVSGNSCKIGKTYGEKECTNPTRVVTSTVRVAHGENPRVSVKTKEAIPKTKVLECAKALKYVCIDAPIAIGDVIVSDIAHTGVDLVATMNVKRL